MKESTHIAIVLDRSGSMQSIRGDTIGGFNTFLADQKKQPGECTLTLAQFDDQYDVVHCFKRLADVPDLTIQTFVPRGSTALLDAIGRTVNETGAKLAALPENERPGRVLLVIITDGMENASREFSREKVFDMLKHQQERYGWAVSYLGANQDAIAVGASLGVPRSSSLSYAANHAGTQALFASASRASTQYRAGNAMQFDDSDRQSQSAAGAQ